MKTVIFPILVAFGLCGLTVVGVSADTTVSSTVQDIKTKVYELIGKDIATITFAKGSSALEESERQNLVTIVAAVRKDAKISSAILAAWSDKEYPAAKDQRLGQSERDLADARLAAIEKVLQDLGVKKVEAHTMAEQPTWFGKLFETEDTMVKGGGNVKDANDQFAVEIGKILRDNGGPGKAVIIVRRVGDQTAH